MVAFSDEKFEAKVNRLAGAGSCWEWLGPFNSNGYGVFHRNGKRYGAHRYAYRLACGAFDAALFVCHKCDNPACVRPDHLFLGDQYANMRDAVNKGRLRGTPRGSSHHSSRLTERAVLEIVSRYRSGATMRSLAREYGVSHVSIGKILSGDVWGHLTAIRASTSKDTCPTCGRKYPLSNAERQRRYREKGR